jgi:hypothetical protein
MTVESPVAESKSRAADRDLLRGTRGFAVSAKALNEKRAARGKASASANAQ